MQAADRVLVITENVPRLNPALAVPGAGGSGGGDGQRPDLSLQHVRVPQQYIESNYPLVRLPARWLGRAVGPAMSASCGRNCGVDCGSDGGVKGFDLQSKGDIISSK